MRDAQDFPTQRVRDLTVADCDRTVTDATERIVACRCDCPNQMLRIKAARARRDHLKALPDAVFLLTTEH